ncbi:MAG: DUF971 domain-containing protein [Planctomycetota bacterium]
MHDTPTHIDLKRDEGLLIEWADGTTSYYTVHYLRKMSPSADMRQLREDMDKNPLAVLPSGFGTTGGAGTPLTVTDAGPVGNYALRIEFSDGHRTGIYSWRYLREIDPDQQQPADTPES